jgi:hypothetical protein
LRHNDCGVLDSSFTSPQISAADRVKVSVIEEHVPPRKNGPKLDEEVWQAWVRKNEAKDKVRLARRKKILAIVLMLGIAAIVLWRVGS